MVVVRSANQRLFAERTTTMGGAASDRDCGYTAIIDNARKSRVGALHPRGNLHEASGPRTRGCRAPTLRPPKGLLMADTDQQWRSWIRQLVEGDPQVAAEFWGQYGARLQGLAAKHLTARLYRRVAPEDVIQSVCRTFWRRAQLGQFELADSESLWRLLCAITLTKVREKARFHQRQKRQLDREYSPSPGADASRAPIGRVEAPDPSPAEAAEFAEELQQLLAGMDDEERQLVEFKLEQHTNPEIAEKLGCSERTVRRILHRVQSRMKRMLV